MTSTQGTLDHVFYSVEYKSVAYLEELQWVKCPPGGSAGVLAPQPVMGYKPDFKIPYGLLVGKILITAFYINAWPFCSTALANIV